MSERKAKEPYEKPVMHVVPLKTDEVLSIGCKNASGNSVPTNPTPPCGIPTCVLTGS